jgi:hypothetical protein
VVVSSAGSKNSSTQAVVGAAKDRWGTDSVRMFAMNRKIHLGGVFGTSILLALMVIGFLLEKR